MTLLVSSAFNCSQGIYTTITHWWTWCMPMAWWWEYETCAKELDSGKIIKDLFSLLVVVDKILTKMTIQTMSLHWQDDSKPKQWQSWSKKCATNTTMMITIKQVIKMPDESPERSWQTKVPLGCTISESICSSPTSIKLKIDQRVGASLMELEFNWLSRILTEDTSVVVITDRLLKVCMMINVHIDLSVQFLQGPFFNGGQRWRWGSMPSFNESPFKTNWTGLF